MYGLLVGLSGGEGTPADDGSGALKIFHLSRMVWDMMVHILGDGLTWDGTFDWAVGWAVVWVVVWVVDWMVDWVRVGGDGTLT